MNNRILFIAALLLQSSIFCMHPTTSQALIKQLENRGFRIQPDAFHTLHGTIDLFTAYDNVDGTIVVDYANDGGRIQHISITKDDKIEPTAAFIRMPITKQSK